MEKTKIISISLFLLLMLPLFVQFVQAQVDKEIEIFGLELEKLLSLVNAWLSLFLAVIAFAAYKRDGRKRLVYIGVAFLLFSVKSFLFSSELFIREIPLLDPLTIILEFFVLLSFFYGVLKR